MKEQLEKLRQEATDSIAKINEALEALKNEKPKFEVGKWYHITTKGFNGPYKTIKFSKN